MVTRSVQAELAAKQRVVVRKDLARVNAALRRDPVFLAALLVQVRAAFARLKMDPDTAVAALEAAIEAEGGDAGDAGEERVEVAVAAIVGDGGTNVAEDG
jgi:hypothetical protein